MNNDILDRYEKAKELLQGLMSNKGIRNDAVLSHWIEGSHHFWYVRQTKEGREFRLVDAKSAQNNIAFDHEALAASLASLTGQRFDYKNLNTLSDISLSISPKQVRFEVLNRYWLFDTESNQCKEIAPPQECFVKEKFDYRAGIDTQEKQEGLKSPDGKKMVFLREHNLWMQDLETGSEQALTSDGAENYNYAQSPLEATIQAVWSPDSERLFSLQQDTRNVESRPVIHYAPRDGSLKPKLDHIPNMPYPGSEHLPTNSLLVIDIRTGDQVRADYRDLQWSGTGAGFFSQWHRPMGWWSSDNRRAFFVDMDRGAKSARVVELDTHTGSTRVLFEETSDTFVRLCYVGDETPLFMPLLETDELIWFSERSGWGQLYLYDLNTGELKNSITDGEWLVRDTIHFDSIHRELILQTAGRDKSISPYYRDICKVNVDTGEITALASGNFEHLVYQNHNVTVLRRGFFGVDYPDANAISHSGEYLVTTRSRVDTAPESVLIDRDGREILLLETADVSELPMDWVWPEPVKLKGSDNKTDIYGVVFRPPGFSEDDIYPVLDFSGGYRFYSNVPVGSFVNSILFEFSYLVGSALAALGFVVVAMEGRGTPCRNQKFSDHQYGEPSSTSDFNDRIAGLRQLAERHSYMDLNRVGISGADGHPNSIFGLLDHPGFYKVAVIHCSGDPRLSTAELCESYDGVPSCGGASKARHAEDCVDSLEGKLLLIDGMLNAYSPAATFRLVDALQKANKSFDMLCLTNETHDVPSYAMRREWDYLVTHLQGIEPPHNFHLTTGFDNIFIPTAVELKVET